MDRYHALLKSQQGKPYYVPSKAELLAYDDAFYCEPTEETNQMREFIETRLQLPEWKKSEVFDELVFGIRCADADFPQVQERLTAMGVHFPRRKDFQTFIERYQAFTTPPGCRATVAIPPMSFSTSCRVRNRCPRRCPSARISRRRLRKEV